MDDMTLKEQLNAIGLLTKWRKGWEAFRLEGSRESTRALFDLEEETRNFLEMSTTPAPIVPPAPTCAGYEAFPGRPRETLCARCGRGIAEHPIPGARR